LAQKLSEINAVTIVQKVEANTVFAVIDPKIKQKLLEEYFFYDWDESRNEVSWMCSWDTTEEDVISFVEKIKELQ